MQLPKLSAPTMRALAGIQVQQLEDLTKFSTKELLALHGFGPGSIKALQKVLSENNLSFKTVLSNNEILEPDLSQ